MSKWTDNLTPEEAALLANWEASAKRHKDDAATYALWKRRLASKVRARMKKGI